MHQQAAVRSEHGDGHRPVLQATGTHLGPGDGGDHLVVVVDHVDELEAGIVRADVVHDVMISIGT